MEFFPQDVVFGVLFLLRETGLRATEGGGSRAGRPRRSPTCYFGVPFLVHLGELNPFRFAQKDLCLIWSFRCLKMVQDRVENGVQNDAKMKSQVVSKSSPKWCQNRLPNGFHK